MIGTTLNFKSNRNFLKLSSTDATVLFILFSFMIGYIIGISLIRAETAPLINLAKNMFEEIKRIVGSGSFWNLLLSAISFFSLFLFVSYLFGTCIIGCAIIPAICVFKGLGEGLVISYIYHSYALSGIGFTVLILAPYFITSSFLLILACRESVCFSGRLLKNILPRGASYNLSENFKLYCVRFIFIFILNIAASILCVICSNLFYDYFNL